MCWELGEDKENATLWVAYGDLTVVGWNVTESDTSYSKSIIITNMSKITRISWYRGSDLNSGI